MFPGPYCDILTVFPVLFPISLNAFIFKIHSGDFEHVASGLSLSAAIEVVEDGLRHSVKKMKDNSFNAHGECIFI